jgi:hypothetical protein
MLRVYFLQNWYALSDPMAEETLYDSEARMVSRGVGILFSSLLRVGWPHRVVAFVDRRNKDGVI